MKPDTSQPPVRLLLVDDDEDYFVITRDLLSEIGVDRYELEWQKTFEEGLQAILCGGHQVCLVDYRLGARTGLELVREALVRGCQAPLILMTGQGDQAVDREAIRAGAADYLVKGHIDAQLLERTIRYAIERSQTLQSLRASEERFRSAFDAAPIGMALLAADGRLLQVNRALSEMLGRSEPELLATALASVMHPEDLPADAETTRQLLAGTIESKQDERRLLHQRGGIVWTQIAQTVVRDSAGKPLHVIAQIQDITGRKQAEEALRQSEEQLRQAQKMEAVGRLAGGVAHDFNNILTVITGYGALLLQKLGNDHPQRREVEEIQKSAERATALTRQLLAFSRKQLLQPKVLDLNAVLAGTDKMLRRVIGEDIELSICADPTIGTVKADPGQIEQVLLNLVVNARDAMPLGGKLTLQTASVVIEQARAERTGMLHPGVYVMMAVTDNGVGMTPEVKTHLFEPFFTTKGLGKGTGLGLATCYGIIRQSGGHIHVYSEPGQGTCFKIYLPAHHEAAKTAEAQTETAVPRRGSERILVVEDEDALRELAACVLRDAGYTVLEACNGAAGLRTVQEQTDEPIDLAVTDVIMPQMGGKEMASRLRQICPKTKILFTSGYTDDALAHHGVLEAGVAFLEKPFSPARLTYRVREVLDGHGNR